MFKEAYDTNISGEDVKWVVNNMNNYLSETFSQGDIKSDLVTLIRNPSHLI